MANPILPLWEYIPDGEPRVFGDRVYLYGSHDRYGSETFCDTKLKTWSASVDNLNEWVNHGHIFHTDDDYDHKSETAEWTRRELYAPDVVEKDGKYYLYTYIAGSLGCVSVSDKPEGPFKLLSRYKYNPEDAGDNGVYNDPGVLVDDDGKVYVYYGFTYSNMNELNPDNMYEVVKGSLRTHVINDDENLPVEEKFFEASSPRKVGDTYYLIYSPRMGSRLAYATSKSPVGPFEYRGYIVDNGVDYPGGNNHGSICKIKDQWYVFYHRMTNHSIMSRRACVEKIQILPDGTIPPVEMTSLGFEESLNPFRIVPAEIACVLRGNCFITEKDAFNRIITDIKNGDVIGYKYFDFGEDFTTETMVMAIKVLGRGVYSSLDVYVDEVDEVEEPKSLNGWECSTKMNEKVKDGPHWLGRVEIGLNDGIYKGHIKKVTGRHALYFVARQDTVGWTQDMFHNKNLFDLVEFAVMK